MTLAESLGTAISDRVLTKILILDCERLPGISRQHWFDRGDLKARYIHYETIERVPRTTIVCAKWHDSPEIIQLAEWDKGGRKRFLRNVHKLISQCQVAVGHNLDQADIPWITSDLLIEGGLPPLPPFKTIDTLKILRRKFKSGAPFKSLDAICQILNLPAKTDRYDREAMERAVTEKSVEDRDRLVAYCASDVVASQALWEWLAPHNPSPPALFVDGKDAMTTCHRCGHDTEWIPRRYIANVLTYTMRRCTSTSCQAYSRISIEPERQSIVRAV